MGSFAILAIMAGLFGLALMDMESSGGSEDQTDQPTSNPQNQDGDGDLVQGDDDDDDSGDDDDAGDDANDDGVITLPEIPFTATANEDGGTDFEITLSNELAAQLLETPGGAGDDITWPEISWQTVDGNTFAGLPELGELSELDQVNIVTPDDFEYEIELFVLHQYGGNADGFIYFLEQPLIGIVDPDAPVDPLAGQNFAAPLAQGDQISTDDFFHGSEVAGAEQPLINAAVSQLGLANDAEILAVPTTDPSNIIYPDGPIATTTTTLTDLQLAADNATTINGASVVELTPRPDFPDQPIFVITTVTGEVNVVSVVNTTPPGAGILTVNGQPGPEPEFLLYFH